MKTTFKEHFNDRDLLAELEVLGEAWEVYDLVKQLDDADIKEAEDILHRIKEELKAAGAGQEKTASIFRTIYTRHPQLFRAIANRIKSSPEKYNV